MRLAGIRCFYEGVDNPTQSSDDLRIRNLSVFIDHSPYPRNVQYCARDDVCGH
jgi:hypothetical protein